MRVTVREIAEQAGVSPATVSLVINNKKGVSEKTRQRVRLVLEKNNYQVRYNKRQKNQYRLVLFKYRSHGMAVEENQGFIASIIDQIEQRCRRLSFNLVTHNCDAKHASAAINEVNLNPPDGIIVIGTELTQEDDWVLETLAAPLVVLDNSMRYSHWDSVVMDNESIMDEAVRHLYDLGHRHIDYFKSHSQISNLDERYEGYLKTMRELNLPVPPPIMLAPTINGAFGDMKRHIRQGEYVPKGAAVADNDSIAIGAAKAIQEAGYSIPEDVSLIGVDDIPYSAVMEPPLSTLRISRIALGTLAVDLMHKRLQNPQWPTMRVRIAGELIHRSSTNVPNGIQEV